MDAISVEVVGSVEAERLCVEFGAKPAPAMGVDMFGLVAVRGGQKVGALLLARQHLSPPGAVFLTVVRCRVKHGLRPAHEQRVRVALLAAAPQRIANHLGETVSVSIRVGHAHPEHAAAPREAGWVERPTCYTGKAWPSGRKIAAMWGEAI